MTPGLPERFLAKVQVLDTGCWLWQASLNQDGYPQFGILKEGQWETSLAHRFSYEQIIGQIPPGFELDHLCRNRACVNPFHLEPVLHRENVIRGANPELSRQRNLAKKTCPQGHPYSLGNTYIDPEGFRHCRICRNKQANEAHKRAVLRRAWA